MIFHFKYISTRSGKALLLFFDDRKYLFNCFEGFQRYSIESSVKLSSLDSVFLFSECNIPPLLGLYLTLGDLGKKGLNIVCNDKFKNIINSASTFAHRSELKFKFSEDFNDGFLKAETIILNEERSYILSLPKIRGKFLVQKAIDLGIPKNLFSTLTKRKVVKHNDIVYDGNNFLEEDVDPGTIAIVYCTKDYEILKKNLKKYKIDYFICFQSQCANFIKSFYDLPIYILEDNTNVEYESLYRIQLDLNSLDPNYLVPIGHDSNLSDKNNEENILFHLYSKDKIIFDRAIKNFIIEKYIPEHFIIKTSLLENKPFVLFLGTGAAIPSKYRNVSSILFYENNRIFLFDCGEDTTHQIHRAFGSFKSIELIELVFISHSHADHHLGLISLLKKATELKKHIKVLGPLSVKEFLEKFDLLKNHTFILNNDVNSSSNNPELNLDYKIELCEAIHCADSHSIKIETGDLSISYSGDTRPNDSFSTLSKNVDLMIHEATFSCDLIKNAIKTKHSTFSEAIDIFKKSNAKKLILTHFSQRYPKTAKSSIDLIVAFDFYKYDFTEEDPIIRKNVDDYFQSLE